MINNLNIFSGKSYVVADEWNANFKAIEQSNEDCKEAITDANEAIAFPDSDLSGLFGAVRSKPNSFAISGTNVVVSPQCEYYKTLTSGQDLNIQVPSGFNSEARIWLKIPDDRTLLPFSVSYSGTTKINYGGIMDFTAGFYLIVLYETNNILQVKLVRTGV